MKNMHPKIITPYLAHVARCLTLSLAVFLASVSSARATGQNHNLDILVPEPFTASGATLVDNGEESTDIIFIITDDSGELTFTLEIPPEGLTGFGEDSRGTDNKMEHIVENIRSIDWPSTNRPTEWSFVEEGDDLQITIDLSKIDENFPMEWEIEFPQTEAGSGKIETNDWSSHQRRQTAEEGENDPGEEFTNPDGRGEVYGGDNPPTTTIRLVKLEIMCVPPSYYADSESWVPFRFRVLGGESPVDITGGKVEFYIGDTKEFDASLTLNPFKPANNTASEYLTVIDQMLFNHVSTSGGVVENARLKLKDVTATFADGSTLSGGESNFSPKFKFGDSSIEIIEFGEDESFDHRKAATRQSSVDVNESNSFTHVGGSRCGIGNPSGGCPYDIGDMKVSLSWLDFDAGFAGLRPGHTATTWTQRSYLRDNLSASGVGSGQSVEARSFNRQRGVYWVAFRNRVSATANGNPFGVPVVGTNSSLAGSITLFETGTASVNIEKGGLNSSDLTTAFGYASTALSSTAFVAGPAAPVMKGAAAILSALTLITEAVTITTSNPEIAEVVAYSVIDLANGTNRPSLSNSETIVREYKEGTNADVPLNIADPGLPMTVDNTYRMYLSHSTNVRALSRSMQSIWIDARLDIDLGTGEFSVAWPTLPPEDINVIACANCE